MPSELINNKIQSKLRIFPDATPDRRGNQDILHEIGQLHRPQHKIPAGPV